MCVKNAQNTHQIGFGVCMGHGGFNWKVYLDIEGLACALGHRGFGVCIGT